MNRRTFLQALAAVPVVPALTRAMATQRLAKAGADGRKLIVVIFGGGTRASESVDDPEHRWIPRIWNQLAPQGTLFNNVRVEGKVVHPPCAAQVLTGAPEWQDNDWDRPVEHPTLLELIRKARCLRDTKAWAFVYASILAHVGHSRADGYGQAYAANVVMPPTIPRSVADTIAESIRRAAARGAPHAEIEAVRAGEDLLRAESRFSAAGLRSERAREFMGSCVSDWRQTPGTTSHDAFLTDAAIRCMREFSPDVIALAYGEIDCAHYGSWSRYVDAIRRTDALTWRVWQAAQGLDAYRGCTLMLVVPDHGRELERPGGSGFVHHSDFYKGTDEDEGCRRVWMLGVGPEVARGQVIGDAVSSRSVAATGLEFMGLGAPEGVSASLWGSLRKG